MSVTIRAPIVSVKAPPSGHKVFFASNSLSWALLSWQAALIILFATSSVFPSAYAPGGKPSSSHPARYAMWMDTHTMMAVGFGMLYTLLRRYSWTGLSVNYLLSALVLQWAILCLGFWENVRARVSGTLPADSFPSVPLSLEGLIDGDYVVATILISFGAVLGRLSPAQATWMAFFETIIATGNVSLTKYLGVADAGGSMVIHCVGASFGLAFAAALGDGAASGKGNGEAVLGTSRTNGVFAMVGTLFLFLFWPSFNAALIEDPASAGRAVINTTLSICGSVVVAFALSKAIHGGVFLDMEHIQNATLAGGVAIGAACDMILNPGAALATGVVAGIASTYGFSYLSPALKRMGLTDTCGIANLHLIPGIIGGVASAIAATQVSGAAWPPEAIATAFPGRGSRSASTQGGYQAAVLMISLALGACSGALSGALLRRVGAYVDHMTDGFYEDATHWNVPKDHEELPELEDAVSRALDIERSETTEAIWRALEKALGKSLGSIPVLPPRFKAPRGVEAAAATTPVLSANRRFTDGSVHGTDLSNDRKNASLHGRSPRKEVSN
jgi:ammonium transporter Rh